MANGKSGYVDFTSGNFTIRVYWSETYDVTANKSIISVDKAQLKSSYAYGYTYYPSGTIKINDVAVVTFKSNIGTHNVRVNARNVFYDIGAHSGYPAAPWISDDVLHGDDGKKNLPISVNVTLWEIDGEGGSGSNISGVKNVELTTIPRKSTLSVDNGTIGTQQRLVVTKQASGFTHTIVATCGNSSVTVCTKVSDTTIVFTPPLSWASQNTEGTSLSVKYTIITFNGNTEVGSNNYTKTYSIPSDVVPKCSITVSEITSFKNKFGAYIQGRSRLKIDVQAEIAYSSKIRSYETSVNGRIYTTDSISTDAIKSPGEQKITAKVTDERGRSGSDVEIINVLAYTAPRITELKVKRCDLDGTENDKGSFVQVTFSAQADALNGENTTSFKIGYKKASEEVFIESDLSDFVNSYIIDNATYIFEADTGSSYDIKFSASDYFVRVEKQTVASTAFTTMHFNTSGNGMAIGKISEMENLLDVALPVRFNSDVDAPSIFSKLSNPNLLINGDFRVNQRGSTSIVSDPTRSATFVVDRWFIVGSNRRAIVNSDGSITLSTTDGGSTSYLNQRFEDIKWNDGKTYTMSANVNGIIRVFTFENDGAPHTKLFEDGIDMIVESKYGQGEVFSVCLGYANGIECTIYWVKLEIGSIATPFVPRHYVEELSECRRYYQEGAHFPQTAMKGIGQTTGYISAYVSLPVPMRVVPTVTISDGNGNTGYCDRFDVGIKSNLKSTCEIFPKVEYINFISRSGESANGLHLYYSADAEIY